MPLVYRAGSEHNTSDAIEFRENDLDMMSDNSWITQNNNKVLNLEKCLELWLEDKPYEMVAVPLTDFTFVRWKDSAEGDYCLEIHPKHITLRRKGWTLGGEVRSESDNKPIELPKSTRVEIGCEEPRMFEILEEFLQDDRRRIEKDIKSIIHNASPGPTSPKRTDQ